jgi:flagellin
MAGSKAESSISKLSSGSRIVKASDDAASLAISNKLRADIATLNQASRNASQGASLLQVAGGGISQIGDILTRMKTLSTQVVNGTLSASERQFAQQEFGQLITQVGETAKQTKVNGIAMLAGGDKTFAETSLVTNTGGASIAASVGFDTDATGDTYIDTTANVITKTNGLVDGIVKAVRVTDGINGSNVDRVELDIGAQTFRAEISANAQQNDEVVFRSTTNDQNFFVLELSNAAYDGNEATLKTELDDLFNLDLDVNGNAASPVSFLAAQNDAATTAGLIGTGAIDVVLNASGSTPDGVYSLTSSYDDGSTSDGVEKVTLRLQEASTGKVYEQVIRDEDGTAANNTLVDAATTPTKTVRFANGLEFKFDAAQLNATAQAASAGDLGSTGNEVVFQVGAGSVTELDFQVGTDATNDLISISFDSMTTDSLGISGLSIDSVSSAQSASTAIDNALSRVNSSIATVGALQSRLEYVQSNLATVTENLEAANGIFKDVDMAKEMTEFTKQQALMQAGVAMLSQSNQMPQQLMRLIQ